MKNFHYKYSEEKQLMQELSESKLISYSQLSEIKSLYHEDVPYHNFIHALKVAESVLKLPTDRYNIIEIKSLFISALFHDAWHKWVAEDLDEFRSLDMAFEGIMNFEKKYDYTGIDYSIVRKAIIWTVFKNRAANTDSYAILLADLDVATIGMSFTEFLYYADFPIQIEFWFSFQNWMKDVGYFKFLLSAEKNVFRSSIARQQYPHALKNMKQYLNCDIGKLEQIFNYWKEHDMNYEGFLKYYEKHIK